MEPRLQRHKEEDDGVMRKGTDVGGVHTATYPEGPEKTKPRTKVPDSPSSSQRGVRSCRRSIVTWAFSVTRQWAAHRPTEQIPWGYWHQGLDAGCDISLPGHPHYLKPPGAWSNPDPHTTLLSAEPSEPQITCMIPCCQERSSTSASNHHKPTIISSLPELQQM